MALRTWRGLGDGGVSFTLVNVPPFGSEAGSSPGSSGAVCIPSVGTCFPGSAHCILQNYSGSRAEAALGTAFLHSWGLPGHWNLHKLGEDESTSARNSTSVGLLLPASQGMQDLTPECWVLAAPFPWLREGRWLPSTSFAHHQRAAHCATRQPVHAQGAGCRRGGGEWGPHRCLPAPSCQLLVAKQLSLFLWRLQRLLLIEEAPTASFSLLLLLLLF